MRPLTFWTLIAAAMFAAMTVLWAAGDDEPTGALLVISSVLWWGSAMVLVVFGLVAISRWRREPAGERRAASRRTSEGSS